MLSKTQCPSIRRIYTIPDIRDVEGDHAVQAIPLQDYRDRGFSIGIDRRTNLSILYLMVRRTPQQLTAEARLHKLVGTRAASIIFCCQFHYAKCRLNQGRSQTAKTRALGIVPWI